MFTGAAGARASSAARASAASRYPRMSNPVSFNVFIHSTIFSAGSMASFDLRVSSAATSHDFKEASGPAASDLLRPGGERFHRDPFHLPHPVFAHDFRLIAKLLNQGFERLPVKLPERYLVRVHVLDKTCFTDLICAERLPFVPVLRGVNDDGMGVYLRFWLRFVSWLNFATIRFPVSTVSLLPSVMTRVAASVSSCRTASVTARL